MSFDKLDRTTQYIVNAKTRASALLNEKEPKLTALEKALWLKLKRGQHATGVKSGRSGDRVGA